MPVGQLRFIVPDPARLSERAVQQAFLSGLDPIPNACRAKLTGGELLVERDGYESTKLNVPWRIDGRGEPLMATATVVQRDRPYLLPLELARGKVNQVRNQLADWLTLGLTPSDKATQRLAEATRLFTRAAVAQHDVDAVLVREGPRRRVRGRRSAFAMLRRSSVDHATSPDGKTPGCIWSVTRAP